MLIVCEIDSANPLSEIDSPDSVLLVGRRHVRLNNSWMHDVRVLERATLHVHPSDAERFQVTDGERVVLESTAGSVAVRVDVTDAVMRGESSWMLRGPSKARTRMQ